MRLRSCALLVGLSLACLAAPAPAVAGTVERVPFVDYGYDGRSPGVDVGLLRHQVTTGGGTTVTVVATGGGIEVTDASGLEAGEGCERIAPDRARCRAAARADVRGGGGGDGLRVDGLPAVIDGGEGADRLTGAGRLHGGAGDDTLVGLADGATMTGGAGADTFLGGPGRDQVTYGERTAAVHADLEGDADDGEQGEGDHVGPGVESLTGGAGPDTLVGDDGANELLAASSEFADPASDVLVGAGGRDRLVGSGADAIDAGDGNDAVRVIGRRREPATGRADGGRGDDDLQGTIYAERLRGGPGRDRLTGIGGADVLVARDGEEDEVTCRFGTGTPEGLAVLDTLDRAFACPRIERDGPARVAVPFLTTRRRILLSCPSDHRRACRARIRVVGGGRALVNRRVVIRPGEDLQVSSRRLAGPVRVRLDARDAAGRLVVVRATLVLR